MRLKNQEFSVAFNGIISLLDKEEITVEYVQKALDEALDENAKLVELRNMRCKSWSMRTWSRNALYNIFTICKFFILSSSLLISYASRIN